jgi:hypothetical protein
MKIVRSKTIATNYFEDGDKQIEEDEIQMEFVDNMDLSNLEEQMDIVAPKKLKQKINCEGLLSN